MMMINNICIIITILPFQVVCGQLLVHWIEAALDQGVERDLWNLGFRNTIAQLQAQAKDKQVKYFMCDYVILF